MQWEARALIIEKNIVSGNCVVKPHTDPGLALFQSLCLGNVFFPEMMQTNPPADRSLSLSVPA
jgi:hypothetical protein